MSARRRRRRSFKAVAGAWAGPRRRSHGHTCSNYAWHSGAGPRGGVSDADDDSDSPVSLDSDRAAATAAAAPHPLPRSTASGAPAHSHVLDDFAALHCALDDAAARRARGRPLDYNRSFITHHGGAALVVGAVGLPSCRYVVIDSPEMGYKRVCSQENRLQTLSSEETFANVQTLRFSPTLSRSGSSQVASSRYRSKVVLCCTQAR